MLVASFTAVYLTEAAVNGMLDSSLSLHMPAAICLVIKKGKPWNPEQGAVASVCKPSMAADELGIALSSVDTAETETDKMLNS